MSEEEKNQSLNNDGEDDDGRFNVCAKCAGRPCNWVAFGLQLQQKIEEPYMRNVNGQIVDDDGQIVGHNLLWKAMY